MKWTCFLPLPQCIYVRRITIQMCNKLQYVELTVAGRGVERHTPTRRQMLPKMIPPIGCDRQLLPILNSAAYIKHYLRADLRRQAATLGGMNECKLLPQSIIELGVHATVRWERCWWS